MPHLRSHGRNREAAELIGAQLGVSGTTVKRVDRLAREAPELLPKVAAGELSVKKALRQVALRKNDIAMLIDPRTFEVDLDLRRLETSITSSWRRCPAEHRARFLRGLQLLLHEIIDEYHAARGQRPAGAHHSANDQPAARAS